MESPPKRMTRARAAAKAGESSLPKTTKIVTAAAKAKTTRTAATATSTSTLTKTTATKRKTRSDEHEDDDTGDESDHPAKIVTKVPRARGRPRKVAAPEPQATEPEGPVAARAARGRPTKKAAAGAAAQEDAPKPVRRTRAKKTQPQEEQAVPAAAAAAAATEPAKKPATRGRAAATTKPAVKKTVTFEEPDKENVAPAATKGKAAAAKSVDMTTSGLRAKPVRRAAAATAARGTRTTAKSSAAKGHAAEEAAKPLSPKKVTQIARSVRPEDVESDDELGIMVGTPLKPFSRSPVKPSVTVHPPAISHSNETDNTEADDKTTQPSESTTSVILGSPVRRPAPSPYKDAMKSPARRVPVLALGASATNPRDAPAQPSFKSSLLQSPAKRPQSAVKTLFPSSSGRLDTTQSPLKLSLLGSPAKRPLSPFKPASPVKAPEQVPISESPAMKPVLLATPVPEPPVEQPQEQQEMADEIDEVEMVFHEVQAEAAPDSPTDTRLKFPGRLSAVLPRHADPALKDTMLAVPKVVGEGELQAAVTAEGAGDPMAIDEPEAEVEGTSSASTTPPHSPPNHVTGVFGLREKDLEPANDSDPESDDDELGSSPPRYGAAPTTPCPAASSRTPKTRTSQTTSTRRVSSFGYTPLANQLSNWAAASSLKKPAAASTPKASGLVAMTETKAPSPAGRPSLPLNETPQRSTFFEDEMSVRPDVAAQVLADAAVEASPSPGIEIAGFDDVLITEEDVALAAEANEMSLLEPEQVEELVNTEPADDSISDASDEYGDENAVPVDPALQPAEHIAVPPVTPQRVMRREFHTVSKIPLKPADDSTPRPVKKRSHSISRLPVAQRPSYGLTRNATVISYSPMKAGKEEHPYGAPEETQDRQERATSAPPTTPTKSEVGWSTTGTPARTPRRDIDPALLRGAVVFVDVHTSEGADASGIFVELLTAMGAKCVKSWPWNPSSPSSQDGPATSKIGITHVVYKDGGKRTLEKVRETGGVVQCVGVSWVLDCERENEWLDEAPYYIDTSFVPRGGARRRKSMEPKALANMNGMLVPTPMRNANSGAPSREFQSAPATPVNRRDSGLWMRTPEDEADNGGGHVDDDDDADTEWDASMLAPVPVTPAPEAIHRYALEVSPETPSTYMDDDGEGDESVANPREAMMTRTCPQPKRTATTRYSELGAGILAPDKDEGVLQRLMAARRKSLQFAPKIGSPLAKAWN